MACANPQLLEWVGEWLEEAKERNTKSVTTLKKAFKSLKACPLPFNHPSEAKSLEGIGDILVKRLTAKMEEYCAENGLPMPKKGNRSRKRKSGPEEDEDEASGGEEPAPKKSRKTKPYVPALRSGPYAIVMALSTLDKKNPGILKDELIGLAQEHSNASFTAPAHANTHYTAWSSMKTLTDKDLVNERGKPKRYSLLDEGWEVAKRIRGVQANSSEPGPSANKNAGSGGDDSSTDSSPARPSASRKPDRANPAEPDFVDIPEGEIITQDSSLPEFTPIRIPSGSFNVELVLDNREIRAKKDRDYIQNELSKQGVDPIVKALPLGDILWVAKITDPALKERLGSDEILLDWVIERKRLDDLIGSIKDGRYKDQKFRLQKSGIKNVIYVIEHHMMDSDHYRKYDEAVETAMASMQVMHGYFVKQTLKMDDTIKYLVGLTKILKARYEGKSLKVIPTKLITAQNYLPLLRHLEDKNPNIEYNVTYPTFASLSSKSDSLTLRDVYLKMLMCTKGVTGEKALAIQRIWKTPVEFVEAYAKCEEGRSAEAARKMKWNMVMDEFDKRKFVGRKKIMKTLSGKISEVWGNNESENKD